MSYTVTAPLVIARDQEGHNHHVYQGGVIPWLSNEQAEHFLAEKLVEKSGTQPETDEDADEELVLFPDEVEHYTTDDVPAKRVAKGELVQFAVSKGADEEAADSLNKDELHGALVENAAE